MAVGSERAPGAAGDDAAVTARLASDPPAAEEIGCELGGIVAPGIFEVEEGQAVRCRRPAHCESRNPDGDRQRSRRRGSSIARPAARRPATARLDRGPCRQQPPIVTRRLPRRRVARRIGLVRRATRRSTVADMFEARSRLPIRHQARAGGALHSPRGRNRPRHRHEPRYFACDKLLIGRTRRAPASQAVCWPAAREHSACARPA